MNPIVSYDCVCHNVLARRRRWHGYGFCRRTGQGRFALAKKVVHVQGVAGKLVATFEETLRVQNVDGWLEMHVDNTAAVAVYITDHGFMVGVWWKKNLVVTFVV